MIVIGLGTGRSGRASLAKLLNEQHDALCFHEMNPSCVRFSGAPRPILNTIDEHQAILDGGDPSMLTVDLGRLAAARTYDELCKMRRVRLIGDIAFYYLTYVEAIAARNPNVRFLCLRRDIDQTVASWMNMSRIPRSRSKYLADRIGSWLTRVPFHDSRNFWMEHDGSLWQLDPIWDKCFPKFEATSKPEAIRKYCAVEDLVNTGGFCHRNTMIVRRALYDTVGGMDESIRWEEDRDLFLRLIDKAAVMLLSPGVVSRHNIPDPAQAISITTSLNEVQRRLFQLRVFEKGSLFAGHAEIRAYGRQYQGYTLKRIAEALAATGDRRSASYYARLALAAGPTVKWAGYASLLTVGALLGGPEGTMKAAAEPVNVLIGNKSILTFIKRGVRVFTAAGDVLTDTSAPSRVLIRQIAGALAEYEKARLVSKLKAARELKGKSGGTCDGRNLGAEVNRYMVHGAKRLRRKSPIGGQRLLREIAAELERLGFINDRGARFSPSLIASMLN